MEKRTLQFIVEASAGELTRGSSLAPVHGISTDSRRVQAGDVFFAIRGERFDGHQFIPEVSKKAAAVVVEARGETSRTGDCAVIVVEETRKALGQVAARYRMDFKLPVIAVAGSNGKTTVKELIASVLRQKLNTLWSEASFNNDIGVPATLLKLETTHEAAVLEAGTNHPGELAPLVRMIQPSHGVITSIGREHLEFFEDLEGVAQEEGWLAELLPAAGKLLLNGDDEWASVLGRRTRATAIRVGFKDGNDWKIRSARVDKEGVTFRVDAPLAEYAGEYRVSLLGRHQAMNALFAVVLGAEFKVSRDRIQQGLLECRPARMRMQFWEVNGVRVLDDAYNANADSMAAALQAVRDLPCKGRRVAVLGDMAELGKHSEAAHEEVGRRAAEMGIGQLFAVGKMAGVMARGARGAGLNRVLEFEDLETAGAAVKQFVREGDLLLLKASRATRLERLADMLRASEAGRKSPAGANGKHAV